MDQAGIKEEFNAYLRNADLVSFEAEKCSQYHYLTSTFLRRIEFSSSRKSPTVLFDLYEKSYTMDLEDLKLLGEIVPWDVTPPLVQFVFVLVLYSLQICAV